MSQQEPPLTIPDLLQKLNSPEQKQIEQSLRYLIHETFQNHVDPFLDQDLFTCIVDKISFPNEYIVRLVYWLVRNFTAKSPLAHDLFLKAGIQTRIVETLMKAANPELLEYCCYAASNMGVSEISNAAAVLLGEGVLNGLVAVVKDNMRCKELIEAAMSALYCLLFADKYQCVGIVDELLEVCNDVLDEVKDSAIWNSVLNVYKLMSLTTDEVRVKMGEAGCVQKLVKLMNEDDDDMLLKSLLVLNNVSYSDENEEKILESGIIPYVLDLLNESDDKSIVNNSLAFLANMSSNEQFQSEVREMGWSEPLKEILEGSDDTLQEPAVRFLVNLTFDEWNRNTIIESGLVDTLNKLSKEENQDEEVSELIGNALGNTKVKISRKTSKEIEDYKALIKREENVAIEEFNNRPEDAQILPEIEEVEMEKSVSLPTEVNTSTEKKRKRSKKSKRKKRVPRGNTAPPGSLIDTDLPKLQKRKTITKELLDTELSYLNNLREFLNKVAMPIMELKEIDSETKQKLLFSEVSNILNIHGEFESSLIILYPNWNAYSKVGELFIDFASELKQYKRFINNYDQAVNLYTNLCNGDLKEVHQQIGNEFPLLREYYFSHFYIQPIQRIPRYRMLLEDLMKNTPYTHPDYYLLNRSLAEIKETATYLNEAKRVAEMGIKMRELRLSINGLPNAFFQLGIREFLKEGHITIKRKLYKKIYYFFLFSDCLVQTQQKRKYFKYKRTIELSNIESIEIHSDKDKPNKEKFPATLTYGSSRLRLRFTSHILRDGWVQFINKAKSSL
eukprot:TRINITY_DN3231_c0_g1_i2.p1 TRINITY_DN3231_c0_g1~~TRINITY_DN3231_c0_g1_i2.p1  ORF type:complete len:787 (+),score=174.19 TRINITY_DN3231_c0_g1_i2:31-2391(+)